MTAMRNTLALIASKESNGDPDAVWNRIKKKDRPFLIIPKHADTPLNKIPVTDRQYTPLTQMTVRQVLAWQDKIDPNYRSEAAGKYQILEDTLREIAKGLEDYLFTEAFQDRMAVKLLKRRGLAQVGDILSPEGFCNRLAMEWASMPVVTDCKGQHGPVKKGQSFYANDGLNRAGVDPDEFLAAVRRDLGAKALHQHPDTPPSREKIIRIQKELKKRGYEVGKVDGVVGPATERAIAGFERENGLVPDGHIDDKMVSRLLEAPEKKICSTRKDVGFGQTFRDLKGSETIRDGNRQVLAGGSIGSVSLLAFAEPYLPQDTYALSATIDFIKENLTVIIVVGAVVVAVIGAKQVLKRAKDHRTGRNMSR